METRTVKRFRFFRGTSKDDVQRPIVTREAIERLLDQRRFEEAGRALGGMALSGDAWARYWLARLTANGLGMAKDDKRAASLFMLAAQDGHAPSQASLGFMYLAGRGVMHDEHAGIEWITKAAEGGDVGAQLNLAKAYSEGKSVSVDDHAAAQWMSRAADSGSPEARLGFAIWTLLGRGVQRDPQRAVDLLNPLAKSGNSEAAHWLERALLEAAGEQR